MRNAKIFGTVINAASHPTITAKVSVYVMVATSNTATIPHVVRFTPPAARNRSSDRALMQLSHRIEGHQHPEHWSELAAEAGIQHHLHQRQHQKRSSRHSNQHQLRVWYQLMAWYQLKARQHQQLKGQHHLHQRQHQKRSSRHSSQHQLRVWYTN